MIFGIRASQQSGSVVRRLEAALSDLFLQDHLPPPVAEKLCGFTMDFFNKIYDEISVGPWELDDGCFTMGESFVTSVFYGTVNGLTPSGRIYAPWSEVEESVTEDDSMFWEILGERAAFMGIGLHEEAGDVFFFDVVSHEEITEKVSVLARDAISLFYGGSFAGKEEHLIEKAYKKKEKLVRLKNLLTREDLEPDQIRRLSEMNNPLRQIFNKACKICADEAREQAPFREFSKQGKGEPK